MGPNRQDEPLKLKRQELKLTFHAPKREPERAPTPEEQLKALRERIFVAEPEKKKSISGFAENLVNDAWGQVKMVVTGVWDTLKLAKHYVIGEGEWVKDVNLFLGTKGETFGVIWKGIKEPWEQGPYERPVAIAVDLATVLSVAGKATSLTGTLAKSAKLTAAGERIARLPITAFSKLGKLAIKPVRGVLERRYGVGEHTPEILKVRGLELSSEMQDKARNLARITLKSVDKAERPALMRAIYVGEEADIANLSKKARKVYDEYADLVHGQEAVMLERRLLTEKRMLTAKAIQVAVIREGKATFSGIKQAKKDILAGKIKPLYAPLISKKSFGTLVSNFTDDVRSLGRVSRLEKRTGRGEFEMDPNIILQRSVSAFHEFNWRLRFLDRVMRLLKEKGQIYAAKAGHEPPPGWAHLQDGIFKKYYEDAARAASVFISEIRNGRTPKEAATAAFERLISDPALRSEIAQGRHIMVPTHVAVLIGREFNLPGPWGRLYDRGLGYWKAAATVFSPRYWISTAIGNGILAAMYGVSPRAFARARGLKENLPPQLRRRAETEIVRADVNWYERKAQSAFEYSSVLDNTLGVGIYGTEAAKSYYRLKGTGDAFFPLAESLEEFTRKMSMAPEELSALQRKIQNIEEQVALRVPEISALEAELARVQSKLPRVEGAVAVDVVGATPIARREKQLADRMNALATERADLLGKRQPVLQPMTREIGAQASRGLPGVERQIAKALYQEHRASVAFYVDLLRDIRSRGGIRAAGGIVEELKTTLPRGLIGGKKGVPADELAQELADRGVIASADQGELFRYLEEAVEFVKRPKVDPGQIRAKARELVRTHTAENLGSIIKNVRESANVKNRLAALGRESKLGQKKLETVHKERAAKEEARQSELTRLQQEEAALESALKAKKAEALDRMNQLGELDGLIPEKAAYAAEADRAIAMVHTFTGKYQELHPIERMWFRRVVPFYAFTKAMIMLSFKFPFLFPKRTFLWNRFSEMVADQVEDEDGPDWLKDYMPILGSGDGSIVFMRVGGVSPFAGVRAGEVGETILPSTIFDPVEQNPFLKVAFEMKGGVSSWTKKPWYPGENAVRLDNGEVYEYKGDGKWRKTVAQPGLLRSLYYTFPQSQLVETLFTGYAQTDRGWVGHPDPIRNPDGSIAYPKELLLRLAEAFGSPRLMKGKPEEFKERERRKVYGIMRDMMREIRKERNPERREELMSILRDFGRMKFRMESRR